MVYLYEFLVLFVDVGGFFVIIVVIVGGLSSVIFVVFVLVDDFFEYGSIDIWDGDWFS